MYWSLSLTSLGFIATALIGASSSDVIEGEADWFGSWKQQQEALGIANTDAACEISQVTAYEMQKGKKPVRFSTNAADDAEMPRIVPMNETAGEQWEFDAVSADGMTAVIFGFYRDPNYSVLGSGNLRMYIELAFPDGERFVQIDYPTLSTIESCPGGGTRGEWKGDGYTYTWQVSSDFKRAHIRWDTPKTKGTLDLRSNTPAKFPDGTMWPSNDASMMALPHFYWFEPMAVGEATLDATFNGKKVEFKGIGGHERFWTAFNWFTSLDAMTMIRLQAGPYSLTFWEFEAWLVKGLKAPYIYLVEDGQVIFNAQTTEESETEDYLKWTKVYAKDGVMGSLADKATGFVLDLFSPSRGKQWTFVISHKNIYFEYFLGEGVGGTGYTATVVGGQIGTQRQFDGVAVTEILKLPKNSVVLKRNFVE